METKVVKFGGSSLASAEQFRKVADIIKSDPSRRYVIPSAPGKRFDGDTKVTDMLYECYHAASKGQPFEDLFEKIKERYNDIIRDLNLDFSLENEFNHIRTSFEHKAGRDYAASRGEYLNGKILANYLGFEFVDAADVIFFDEQGVFASEITNEVVKNCLHNYEYAVIPGFYGSMPNDTIKTFSRGGSDITGSIVARATSADLYENWTDVSGFLVADPRIVENPDIINVITYRELRELSYMGATVLHEDAIFPVRKAGITINIRNTNAPEHPGTRIVARPDHEKHRKIITGIAGKKGFSVIRIEKDQMNQEIGFGKRMLEVLEKHNMSFEHLPSGIDTMSVVLSTADLKDQENAIISDLFRALNPDSIDIDRDLALIAVVGRRMIKTPGVAARLLAATAKAGVNIRMIDQGSSELNIIIGVDEADFETTVKAIYNEFCIHPEDGYQPK